MRKTIKKVMIVVPVLMTSCQVSLNPKSGPVTAHATTTETAIMNVTGLPVTLAVNFAKRENQEVDLVAFITPFHRDEGSRTDRAARRPMLLKRNTRSALCL